MSALYWTALGLIFVGFDVASVGATGFVSMIVGIAMLVTALLTQTGILPGAGMQCVATAIFSLTGLLASRRVLSGLKRRPQEPSPDALIGVHCTARGLLDAGGQGHIELRGTLWQAQNTTQTPIDDGASCIVTSIVGITLGVCATNSGRTVSQGQNKDLL